MLAAISGHAEVSGAEARAFVRAHDADRSRGLAPAEFLAALEVLTFTLLDTDRDGLLESAEVRSFQRALETGTPGFFDHLSVNFLVFLN